MASRSLMFAVLLMVPMLGCINEKQQLEIELRRSFKNFVASVNERHVEGLHISVFFPGVSDYKEHVTNTLFTYLDELRLNKPITFDEQGVVLSRFLGMIHHNYLIKDIETLSERDIRMRISYRFSYDATIKQANFEKGTKVYIPANPWGTAHLIEVGVDAPAPREQLQAVEILVTMRRTNHEGFWQVRECKIDEDSLEWETSIETEFYSGE